MATAARISPSSRFDRIVTDRVLAAAALVMLGFVAVAVARGHADWAAVPWPVWVHLGTIAAALALTPAMLLRRKGTRSHRVLGYVWTAAMVVTAAESLTFKTGAAARQPRRLHRRRVADPSPVARRPRHGPAPRPCCPPPRHRRPSPRGARHRRRRGPDRRLLHLSVRPAARALVIRVRRLFA